MRFNVYFNFGQISVISLPKPAILGILPMVTNFSASDLSHIIFSESRSRSKLLLDTMSRLILERKSVPGRGIKPVLSSLLIELSGNQFKITNVIV